MRTTRFKETKNPTATSEELEAKLWCLEQTQGTTHAPCTHHQLREVGKPPKPPLWPDPSTHLYPHPIKGTSSPLLREPARNLLLVLTPPAAARAPVKPGFPFWPLINFYSVQSLSHVQLFATPMDCSTPGFHAHHQLPEPAQTHVHRVTDAIQPSRPLSSTSPPAFNLSQHQGPTKCDPPSHKA